MKKSRKYLAGFLALSSIPMLGFTWILSMHMIIFAGFILMGPKEEKLGESVTRAGRWWLNMSLIALAGVILMSLLR